MSLKGVRETKPLEELETLIGSEVGLSEWVLVDQKLIDSFADGTHDHQYIHVDPEAAKKSPYGKTVAHGFLTLSLVSHLLAKMSYLPDGTVMALNYGLDKVRFLAPVPSGSLLRLRCKLSNVERKAPEKILLSLLCDMESKEDSRIVMSAQLLIMAIVEE